MMVSAMARVPLVYHENYDLHFGRHVFPTQKYRLIRELLLTSGEVAESDFHQPQHFPAAALAEEAPSALAEETR